VLVTGLFTNSSDAEGALDNLDEAGYDAGGISVIAADQAVAARLTRAAGPLSRLSPQAFVERLATCGLPVADGAAYAQALARGAVAVTVTAAAGTESDAAEILSDQKAQRVQRLRDVEGSA
jgi:hypothetical protein